MIGILALQGAFLEHVAAFAALGVPTREVRSPAELAGCAALVIPGGESTAMALIAQRTGMVSRAAVGAWACASHAPRAHLLSCSRARASPRARVTERPPPPPPLPRAQWEPLRAWVASGRPTWGTCAGMVLLAERAQGGKAGGQPQLGGVGVEVHRNYFGPQAASFQAELQLEPAVAPHFAARGGFTGVFIRAPAILHTSGPTAVPLAWVTAPRRDAQVPVLPSSVPTSHSSDAARVIVAAQDRHLLVTAFHPELTGDPAWHALFARQVEAATGAALLGTVAAPARAAPAAPALPGAGGGGLTPGTTAASSFRAAAASASGAAARGGGGGGPPPPLGRECSDADTAGHAQSHAIARRAILHPPQ